MNPNNLTADEAFNQVMALIEQLAERNTPEARHTLVRMLGVVLTESAKRLTQTTGLVIDPLALACAKSPKIADAVARQYVHLGSQPTFDELADKLAGKVLPLPAELVEMRDFLTGGAA